MDENKRLVWSCILNKKHHMTSQQMPPKNSQYNNAHVQKFPKHLVVGILNNVVLEFNTIYILSISFQSFNTLNFIMKSSNNWLYISALHGYSKSSWNIYWLPVNIDIIRSFEIQMYLNHQVIECMT